MSIPIPELPDENTTICLVIPDSQQWRQIYMGALLILQQWWYYNTNDANEVEDVVQRVMECHYLTSQNYEGCKDMDCQGIIDCINSTPELRQLLQSLSIGQTGNPVYDTALNRTAFDESGGCDNDVIWGYISAIVDFIDAQNVDFLQQMAEALNIGSGLDQLLQLIPGYELLPFDDIQDFIESFGDYNLEAYNASMTTAVRNQIKCDLFCLAIDSGCTLDFGDVLRYFLDEVGDSAIDLATIFSEWVFFMVVGSYPSDKIVFIWSAFQLFLVMSGNKFLGLDTLTQYQNALVNGDPDNDWETLCDECEWEQVFDFTVESFASLVDDEWDEGYPANWQSGLGWVMGQDSLGARGGMFLTIPEAVTLTFAQVETYINRTATNTRGNGVLLYENFPDRGNNDDYLDTDIYQSTGNYTNTLEGNFSDIMYVAGIAGSRNGASAVGRVTKMTLRGTGENPFT